MSKDVIEDRYARLYEIPFQLARLGHDVLGVCLGYQGQADDVWEHVAVPGRLRWKAHSAAPGGLGFLSHPGKALNSLRAFKPDVLIGASDIPHIALVAWLAKKLDVPYAVDLYDNFEGFGQARLPGFVRALRRATRSASLVLTTSEPLRQFVAQEYDPKGDVIAMPSTIDRDVFKPRDKVASRRSLDLPVGAQLVGTAGGLYRAKGIEPLYQAWGEISARQPDVHLVLAGPQERGMSVPSGSHVHYLGNLTHARVAELFSALDVGVISILDSRYGRYSFPQKAYEMLACGIPIVAARVGDMEHLFSETPDALFEAGNAGQLAAAIERQLAQPLSPQASPRSWTEVIADIEPRLRALARPVPVPAERELEDC